MKPKRTLTLTGFALATGLANARLIAAAPELLAVLKAALPLLHTSDELPMNYFADKPGVLGEALRIIAKIEGELK